MTRFLLDESDVIAEKYQVVEPLGAGYEGEVYLVSEVGTGIERALKLFYPERNKRRSASRKYARKLHKLRSLPALIQYHAQEEVMLDDQIAIALVSEYIEGELLSAFINRQSGKRCSELQAALLLHELTTGIEDIHLAGEYHGDLHSSNIIVCRYGLGFDVKFVDFYDRGRTTKDHREFDIICLVQIFYDSLGGAKRYHTLSPAARYICAGMKSNHILNRFKTVTHLRNHLEHMSWDE